MSENGSASSREQSVRRRDLLRAIGATAMVGGLPAVSEGVAGERAARRQVRAAYADPETAERAVAEHAAEVLEVLADKGLLPEASLSSFPTEEVLSATTFADAGAGLFVGTDERGGDVAAHILATTQVAGTEVTLVVEPDRGRAFARVVPAQGDRYRIDGDGSVRTYGWTKVECRYDECGQPLPWGQPYHGTCYVYDCHLDHGQTADCDKVGTDGCCGRKAGSC